MRERKNKHYVAVPGTGGKPLRLQVRAVDANSGASFNRTRQHVLAGTEGEPCTCANAIGACEQLGGAAWEFTDTRAFKLVTDRKGRLYKAIVYAHDQVRFQQSYDKLGKKKMLESPDCEGEVHLYPPPPYTPIKGARKPASPKNGQVKTRKNRSHFRGPLARMRKAGLIAEGVK